VSGGLGSEGGFTVLGHYLEYGNYDSPNGEVLNSGFQESGVLVKAAHRAGPGMLTASWQGDWGRDIGRPRNNSQTVRFYYPEENSSRFTLNYDVDPLAGFSKMGLTGFFGTYGLITEQDRFATSSRSRSIERADVTANDFSVRAFAERFVGLVRVEAGVDVNGRYDLHALDISIIFNDPPETNVNVSVDDARKTDVGGYLTAEAQIIPQLTASGGVRYDSVTTSSTGGYFGDLSTSDGNPSGFIGLTAGSFGGFSATAQFSAGYRDPTLSDRYYRGPSGRGFITGNPDLEPETSMQYDFALRYLGACYRVALYGYQYDIDRYIERYAGTPPDDFFFRNRGQAQLRGLELEVQADLSQGFSLALAAQIERGETTDDDRPLDDVPPESINLQLRRNFGKGYAQIRGAAFAANDNPGPTEIATAGYGILDLGGGFNVTPWLELQAYVRNVLDHRYAASPDPRNVLAPGINATFTAFLRF
jgi:outer membrane receptor protein involved in Fe transport